MDKQTTLGFILIGIVLIVWMWLNAPPPPQQHSQKSDSLSVVGNQGRDTLRTHTSLPPDAAKTDSLGKYFGLLQTGEEKVLIIKTDLYTAELTTKGGLVRKWELAKYQTWDKHPVNLIDGRRGGDFSLLFTSGDGKLVNTRKLYFTSDFPAWKTVELRNSDSFSLDLRLAIVPGQSVIKRYTFINGRYSFDAELQFENTQSAIANYEYQVTWEHGLPYAEANSIDESNFAMAYAYSGGELAEIDASKTGEHPERDINGATDWVATRNKYFAVALLPENTKGQGAFLQGEHLQQPDHGVKEDYSIALKMPLKGQGTEKNKVTVYLGPLEYDNIKSLSKDLDKIMSFGASWIRPITEYVMLPVFKALRSFIPNFGIVIIVFSILIKIVLHPLTKTTMKSSRQMQALQPLMNELREKYKDDPQKMNHATMNLYKEYGVNPAAGCLPVLLQMPILFALYALFNSTIDLRHANFVGWIHDLSIPDTIFTLPFTLPLFGIKNVSGLALAMGVTMFVQQKMTVTDPRQKAMVWMMPVLMTLLFNSFPSGLNLYYFVFNLLSIGQQALLNKTHGNEPLKKVDPKKASGGFMAKLTKDLPKLK